MTSEPSPHLISFPCLLLLLLALAGPAHLTPAASGSQARGHRSSWEQEQDAIKVRVDPLFAPFASTRTRTCTFTCGSSRGPEVHGAGTKYNTPGNPSYAQIQKNTLIQKNLDASKVNRSLTLWVGHHISLQKRP